MTVIPWSYWGRHELSYQALVAFMWTMAPSIGHHQVVMQQFHMHMQTFGPKISSDRRKSHGPFIDGKVPCPGGSRGGTLCFALSFRSCPAGCSGCVAGSCGRSGCGVHGVASLGLWHARCSDPVGPSARRQAHQGAGLGGANSRGRWLDRWSDRCSLCSCPGWSHCSSGPCQDPVLRHQPHQVQDCQGQGLHHSLHETPHWERLLSTFLTQVLSFVGTGFADQPSAGCVVSGDDWRG